MVAATGLFGAAGAVRVKLLYTSKTGVEFDPHLGGLAAGEDFQQQNVRVCPSWVVRPTMLA